MKKIKLGAAVALLACLVLFLLQNLRTAEVKFLVWEADLSIAIPIIVAFFAGGFAARPLMRFLNEQRRERKQDRAVSKAAAKAAAKANGADDLNEKTASPASADAPS